MTLFKRRKPILTKEDEERFLERKKDKEQKRKSKSNKKNHK
ncbi:hypothetical protein [Peribacillus tepidiphilus]|jgi:hypothetical protein